MHVWTAARMVLQGIAPRFLVRRERGERVAKPRKASADVFLNIPYDNKFQRLFLAYISGISAFGIVPRATLEISGSSRRLDRNFELLHACQYSIPDLSRIELDRRT